MFCANSLYAYFVNELRHVVSIYLEGLWVASSRAAVKAQAHPLPIIWWSIVIFLFQVHALHEPMVQCNRT